MIELDITAYCLLLVESCKSEVDVKLNTFAFLLFLDTNSSTDAYNFQTSLSIVPDEITSSIISNLSKTWCLTTQHEAVHNFENNVYIATKLFITARDFFLFCVCLKNS